MAIRATAFLFSRPCWTTKVQSLHNKLLGINLGLSKNYAATHCTIKNRLQQVSQDIDDLANDCEGKDFETEAGDIAELRKSAKVIEDLFQKLEDARMRGNSP